MPIRSALPELVAKKHLWINALRTERAAEELLSVELAPWRTKAGKILKRSGLTDRGDEVPALDPQDAKLDVRWKARPGHLARGSVQYRIAVITSGTEVEIASQPQMHSARSEEKCVFTQDDFLDLPEDAVVPAKVVLSVVGNASTPLIHEWS